ncbi:hypothetical protein Ancab_024138 [Ancistrocladus abbreviatus]
MEGAEAGSNHQNQQLQQQQKSSIIIEIPSYQEVLGSSQSKSSAPSLFTPSQTFSQAFSHIKKSEFYTPPPSRSLSTSSQLSENAVGAPSSSGQIGQPEASSSAPTPSSGSSSFVQKTNAILVSHRQEDVVKPLLEVTKTALLHDCTLLCGWSLEECGRYLETIKVYENKPADIIQGHIDTDYLSRLNHALTAIRHVNKTDVVTLGSTFGSLSNIMDASMEDLARCPGIGERKVKRLYDTFHEPFKRTIPIRPSVPETASQTNAGLNSSPSEVPAVEEETGEASKRKKKEPELTVKSALSAAFAKYTEKLGKKNNKPTEENGNGGSAQTDPIANASASREGAAG